MGKRVAYVRVLSRTPWNIAANRAVNRGAVAPIIWLNEIAMYLRDMFPKTTVTQNSKDRRATRETWLLLRNGCTGSSLAREKQKPRATHTIIWHRVRNTGCRKDVLESNHLLSSSTQMLEAYQDRMTAKVTNRLLRRAGTWCGISTVCANAGACMVTDDFEQQKPLSVGSHGFSSRTFCHKLGF